MEEFKSGFVGIIGRPNVGKSTLVNCLVNQKVAIVSEKPQTTRHKIRCVVNRPGAQIIFIDTPGFHKPKDQLSKHLNRTVRSTLREVDAILFVIDASQVIGAGDCFIANELQKLDTPVALALNKIDKVDPFYLEAQMEIGRQLGDFEILIPISALEGRNIVLLLDKIIGLLPSGPKYYPEEVITDQPESVIIAELIREKVLELTREEVPHSVAVEVEEIRPREGKDLIDVFGIIHVERESQKGILIGKQGKMLREIGYRSRLDIQSLLGSQANLQLRVKVRKNWRRDESSIHQFGYY